MKAKATPTPLPDPCSVGKLRDGSLYQLPSASSWQETTYSRLMILDDTFIKLASHHGFEEYEKYVVRETVDDDAIRGNESLEKFAHLQMLEVKYPEFHGCSDDYGKMKTHWLLLHKLQYNRLKKNTGIAIPEARFVFFSKRRFVVSPSIHPGFVQKRVPGICLWDMIDHEVVLADSEHDSFVREKYKRFLPQIAAQLSPLVNSPWSNHINWFIKNFIFDTHSGTLYYVDMKPSNIFGKWRNDRNLTNIQRDFLQ